MCVALGQNMVLELDDEGAAEIPEDEAWPETQAVPQSSELHPRDLDNVEKLCAALKIFLSKTLSKAQVEDADRLLREYCTELLEVCSSRRLAPGHTHPHVLALWTRRH